MNSETIEQKDDLELNPTARNNNNHKILYKNAIKTRRLSFYPHLVSGDP